MGLCVEGASAEDHELLALPESCRKTSAVRAALFFPDDAPLTVVASLVLARDVARFAGVHLGLCVLYAGLGGAGAVAAVLAAALVLHAGWRWKNI